MHLFFWQNQNFIIFDIRASAKMQYIQTWYYVTSTNGGLSHQLCELPIFEHTRSAVTHGERIGPVDVLPWSLNTSIKWSQKQTNWLTSSGLAHHWFQSTIISNECFATYYYTLTVIYILWFQAWCHPEGATLYQGQLTSLCILMNSLGSPLAHWGNSISPSSIPFCFTPVGK